MYENITYEEILGRILDRVPEDIDKREGSIIYDAVAPLAVEILLFYNQLYCMLNETYADTASENYLLRRCEERGIFRKPAVKSKITAEFLPDDINVINKRFSCDGTTFRALEEIRNGIYILECETAGPAGNIFAGNLIPLENIAGLSSSSILELFSRGEPAEDIENLRHRFLESLKAQSFSGNISDYKEKANSVSGVGGVKVYPAFFGGGTVKLVIIDSVYKKPSQTLVQLVKNVFDPEDGNGVGLAPIGHSVSVFGVENVEVSVSFNCIPSENYTYQFLLPFFEKVIDDYFCELSENWADKAYLSVRISQIESRRFRYYKP